MKRGEFRSGNGRQWGGAPLPVFSDVWQTKDFKSNEFVSVATKGVTERVWVSVARKRVSENGLGVRRSGEGVERALCSEDRWVWVRFTDKDIMKLCPCQ